MEVTLKKITKEDLDFARKLRNKNRKFFFDSSYVYKERHLKWFRNLLYDFYIIWLGEERIGTVGVKYYQLHNVIIDEKYRHRGILKKLLKDLDVNSLEVLATNTQAIRAYKKLGFKPTILEMQK